MKALKDSDEDRHEQVCTELRSDGAYVDQGEQDNLIVQKIEGNPNAVGVFGYSYLEENADKVQGLPMNGVDADLREHRQLQVSGRAPALHLRQEGAPRRDPRACASSSPNGPSRGARTGR